jgi:thiol-disulfide isomerase/thioredoxin/mono/diheme cytochrome c family protein
VPNSAGKPAAESGETPDAGIGYTISPVPAFVVSQEIALMRRSIAFLALTALAPLAFAADPPAPVGTRVADFTLPDAATGKPWSLADHTREANATVLLFVGTGCPVNNAYLPKLGRWHERYSAKGVVFVAVNCHPADDMKAVAEHAKANGIPFPVLKDDGKTAARLQVDRIPTAVVLDSGRTVRYFGRIDDQFTPGVHREKAATREMANAIDAVLAKEEVKVPFVPAAGCKLTKEVAAAKGGEAVTYHKQVSRIFQAKCQECHRAGEAAPFELLTYKQAKGWAGMIGEVVADNVMPPWHADAPLGHFANDRRLTPAEKETVLAWVDQGCLEGDAKDAPPPRKFVSGWRLGREPDQVLPMNKTIDVPAQFAFGLTGMPYQYVMAGEPFAEDKWVQAVEVRPDYRAVIHHIIVFIIPPGKELHELREANLLNDGMLATYVPGDLPVIYPKGTARKVTKGSRLLFEVHYTPNGKAGKDRSTVGIVYADGKPEHEIHGRALANKRFVIPPGESNHEVKSKYTFKQDSLLTMMSPHMHVRGKAFKYELVTPDGKRETLLSVPKYDFNWQASYTLATPKDIPAGATIECTAWFDNSTGNPFNPDPKKQVRWGEQTWEEMMIGFLDYRAK